MWILKSWVCFTTPLLYIFFFLFLTRVQHTHLAFEFRLSFQSSEQISPHFIKLLSKLCKRLEIAYPSFEKLGWIPTTQTKRQAEQNKIRKSARYNSHGFLWGWITNLGKRKNGPKWNEEKHLNQKIRNVKILVKFTQFRRFVGASTIANWYIIIAGGSEFPCGLAISYSCGKPQHFISVMFKGTVAWDSQVRFFMELSPFSGLFSLNYWWRYYYSRRLFQPVHNHKGGGKQEADIFITSDKFLHKCQTCWFFPWILL